MGCGCDRSGLRSERAHHRLAHAPVHEMRGSLLRLLLLRVRSKKPSCLRPVCPHSLRSHSGGVHVRGCLRDVHGTRGGRGRRDMGACHARSHSHIVWAQATLCSATHRHVRWGTASSSLALSHGTCAVVFVVFRVYRGNTSIAVLLLLLGPRVASDHGLKPLNALVVLQPLARVRDLVPAPVVLRRW